MCVTSAPASASSLAASAAIRALYESVRIEPAKTRILGSGIGGSRTTDYDRCRVVCPRRRAQALRYTHTRAGGRLNQMRSEASAVTPAIAFGIGGMVE